MLRFMNLKSLGLVALLLFVPITVLAQEQDENTETGVGFEETDCNKNSPWCKVFFFGIQFLPDYDENNGGGFSGLNEQALFGHFNFDAIKKGLIRKKASEGDQRKEYLDNFGFNISLYQSGSISEDEESVPKSFNQISDSVSIEAYYSLNFKDNIVGGTKGSTYGTRLLVGSRTRDGSIANEDTLSTYAALGFHYSFYNRLPEKNQNSVPAGEFFVGAGWFEDWAGREIKFRDLDEELRLVFRGSYNIGGRWFLGLYGVGGKGPDDVSIFFGTKRTTDELLEFIGLKPRQPRTT